MMRKKEKVITMTVTLILVGHTDLYKSHSLCDNRTSIETMQDSISIPSYSRH